MSPKLRAVVLGGLLPCCAASASATTLTFDDLRVGTVLSNQYASLGAVFSANAFAGAGSSSSLQDWATDTDMTIVGSTGSDVGSLGTPSLVRGNLLHAYSGWLREDGDASFRVTLGAGTTGFSATFAGVATPADVRLFVYDGSTLLGTVAGTVTTGQFTLSYAASAFSSVVIAPGSYDDWVGVDSIAYTPAAAVAAVPEPGSDALMGLGLALVTLAARRTAKR